MSVSSLLSLLQSSSVLLFNNNLCASLLTSSLESLTVSSFDVYFLSSSALRLTIFDTFPSSMYSKDYIIN